MKRRMEAWRKMFHCMGDNLLSSVPKLLAVAVVALMHLGLDTSSLRESRLTTQTKSQELTSYLSGESRQLRKAKRAV